MKRFLKLVNFEFNRFFKIYLVLIGMTIIFQLVGLFFQARSFLGEANKLIYEDLMPKEEFLNMYGPMTMHSFMNSLWFAGPIAICIVTLLIYVFFIWYRDWLGKNTFIYRLLMLPTNRINIYLSKAVTILLFVLGLVALQLILFTIESEMLTWLVPDDLRLDLSLLQITSYPYLFLLFPKTLFEFVIFYGIGMIAVLSLFTFIIFERSFRLKGIVVGAIYLAISFGILILPLFTDIMMNGYFYPMELFLLEVLAALVVISGTVWTSYYLLNHKIRV